MAGLVKLHRGDQAGTERQVWAAHVASRALDSTDAAQHPTAAMSPNLHLFFVAANVRSKKRKQAMEIMCLNGWGGKLHEALLPVMSEELGLSRAGGFRSLSR
ncbi:hypothetical protein CLV76_107199 [Marivita geojedonensis]|nr:hypothetical protein CLV76_107199 [Marivita geojedonensis]